MTLNTSDPLRSEARGRGAGKLRFPWRQPGGDVTSQPVLEDGNREHKPQPMPITAP